jgi:DNA-binding response OmpR family regulator
MSPPATVLVVDDQPALLEGVRMTLEAAGYCVLTAADGVEALAVLQDQEVQLILADIAMPRLNGYQLYQRLREDPRWLTIPFVFLTARALDSDIRYGKELGVDDYLTKPVQPEDLLAVVQGKLRRAGQLATVAAAPTAPGRFPSALVVGQLQIASGQHRAWLRGQELELSAREFVLLEHLARHAGQVIPPRELIQATHGLATDDIEAGSLLRPLVRSLRRKLGYGQGEMGCLENVRGVGYRLVPPA